MPVPKKRRSRSRKRTRGAAWKIVLPNLKNCAQCGTPIISHRACPNCGDYKGQQVIVFKEKKSASKDA
jgi:large subunit ribosomal protein L32